MRQAFARQRDLSEALSSAGGSKPSKAAQARVAELRKVVADLEDRAKGGPAKRQAAAKKAAATRRRRGAAQRRGEEGRAHAREDDRLTVRAVAVASAR